MSNVLPEGGFPRIFRFVEPGTIPARGVVALLDTSKNLLIIDKEKFSQLNEMHQQIVLTTGRTVIETNGI